MYSFFITHMVNRLHRTHTQIQKFFYRLEELVHNMRIPIQLVTSSSFVFLILPTSVIVVIWISLLLSIRLSSVINGCPIEMMPNRSN